MIGVATPATILAQPPPPPPPGGANITTSLQQPISSATTQMCSWTTPQQPGKEFKIIFVYVCLV